ncbi:hypothetical protein [Acanthopleuribacter pedis]|uniref:Uncharacterized protein n=1 Tax=Acanthopleuribacter pedis TaxID=442870 RepID=A0A8J7Q9S9_9BACT|nr:hypothetical protein [Acanthopleuribacter pedis]MBO1321331.1 hypothetical protein [Acanthopleuribacter pedis]
MFHILKNDPRFTFGFEECELRAMIIGLEWQVIMRSKLFTIRAPRGKKSNAFGFDFIYKKVSAIFELQIERHEEVKVLAEMERILHRESRSLENVRKKAISFITFRRERGKLTEAAAAARIKKFKESDGLTILYGLFNLAGIKILKTLFPRKPRR